jgi:probable biosynthetic protein (TIGR04098 family)
MTETLVGMPETNVAGLSEGWLLQHCGDQHWRRVCAALGAEGVGSTRLRDDHGSRLYPTFVAVSARYSAPLSAVGLDERLLTSIELAHFGRTFFRSRVTVAGEAAALAVEMVSAFAAREREGRNGLYMTAPAGAEPFRARALGAPPALLRRAQALRHGELGSLDLGGHRFALGGAELATSTPYEPSPYTEFNGAGLLYFAAYASIGDTLERQLVRRLGLAAGGRDWSLAASTVARDVFYQRNLDLGESLEAHLLACRREGCRVALHTRLTVAGNGPVLADLFTVKALAD